MLKAQFDGDVLAVRPDGPITREDVGTLTRMADEYLAGHPKIAGVMVETRAFPGFASVGAFADYARFIADHHAHVRRLALVTDFSSRAGRGVHGQSRRGSADAALPVCRGRSGTGVAQVALSAAWATGVGSHCRISVGHSGQRIAHRCRWGCGSHAPQLLDQFQKLRLCHQDHHG